jgi:hypothetical protein
VKALVGGVQTPYQVVAITKQLLDKRVQPQAIAYVVRYIDEMGELVALPVEAAGRDARKPIIDNWIIPQPEPARVTRRAFVEAGLADLKGPDIEGYGKLLGHGWLLKQFTPEALSATPLPAGMERFKAILDSGDILIGVQLDQWNTPHVPAIFEERKVRGVSELDL